MLIVLPLIHQTQQKTTTMKTYTITMKNGEVYTGKSNGKIYNGKVYVNRPDGGYITIVKLSGEVIESFRKEFILDVSEIKSVKSL